MKKALPNFRDRKAAEPLVIVKGLGIEVDPHGVTNTDDIVVDRVAGVVDAAVTVNSCSEVLIAADDRSHR